MSTFLWGTYITLVTIEICPVNVCNNLYFDFEIFHILIVSSNELDAITVCFIIEVVCVIVVMTDCLFDF